MLQGRGGGGGKRENVHDHYVYSAYIEVIESILAFLDFYVSILPLPMFLSAVDIWSIGCIFGELIRGSVLFPGGDRILFQLMSKAV